MRAVVFRSLAGLLALLAGFVLVFLRDDHHSVVETIGIAIVGLVMATYAFLGTHAAEWVVATVFGVTPSQPDPSPYREQEEPGR